jgi:Fe-S oxidoreductase
MLRDTFVFPEIALKLCPAPCADVCERNGCDQPVNLHGLESAAVALTKKKEPLRLNVPPKAEKIAVVGGGLSGLACAMRLSSRGYRVIVYEKADRLGGSLWEHFPDGSFLEEIQMQFTNTNCEFKLSSEVKDLESLGAEAVYVATGRDGEDFGGGSHGALLGGALLGKEGIFALSQGIEASNRIEHFLKTGVMPEPEGPPSRPANKPDPSLLIYLPQIIPADNEYTAEEAAQEAARCVKCDCDACARRCHLIMHYKKFPDRIASETEATVRPTDLVVNRFATRMVASCDQCGSCAEICPRGVDLRGILADAKREMKSKGDMPEAFSVFWLEDMAHAEENAFYLLPPGAKEIGQPDVEKLVRPDVEKLVRPGAGKPGYMFFPGCRLGASDPRYVTGAYTRLLEKYPDTALLTDCCGAPAIWAGDTQHYVEKSARLREKWEAAGSPVPICACPTCANMLRNILPGCEPVSLYALDIGNVLHRYVTDKPEDADAARREKDKSVFDPCAARHDPQAQDGVRKLLEDAGYHLSPLAYERENALCCGWGGQSMIANPRMFREATKRCAALSETDYVTYCVNCRDALAETGKRIWHILDIILGIEPADEPLTHSKRRANREMLRWEMTGARQCGGIRADNADDADEAHGTHGADDADEAGDIGDLPPLYLADDLRKKLSEEWILERDVLATILHCERQNRKIINGKMGSFAGYLRQGFMTHWVEYKPEGEGYRLLNAYAHRVVIEESRT